MMPGMTIRANSRQSTFLWATWLIAETPVVKLSTVCTPAEAAAGGTPMLTSRVELITPNAMPSAPSTNCAANPIRTKMMSALGSARNCRENAASTPVVESRFALRAIARASGFGARKGRSGWHFAAVKTYIMRSRKQWSGDLQSGLLTYLDSVKSRDPAARSRWEVLLYPGVLALALHRVAHWLFDGRLLFPRAAGQPSRAVPDRDRHPSGREIGRNFFIDHGFTVIGETAEIGDDVTIYQCVTLGGTNPTTGIGGKRHPTLKTAW